MTYTGFIERNSPLRESGITQKILELFKKFEDERLLLNNGWIYVKTGQIESCTFAQTLYTKQCQWNLNSDYFIHQKTHVTAVLTVIVILFSLDWNNTCCASMHNQMQQLLVFWCVI